jgi:hypothetical protein
VPPAHHKDVPVEYAISAHAQTAWREALRDPLLSTALVEHYKEDYLLFGAKLPAWVVGVQLKQPSSDAGLIIATASKPISVAVSERTTLGTSQDTAIQRIYFINLESAVKRRQFMEKWLSGTNVAYERIEAQELAVSDLLVDKRCGLSVCPTIGCPLQDPQRSCAVRGLIASNIKIMDTKNTSGLTLVLEDDYKIKIRLLSDAIKLVPQDWDVIRFNCKGLRRHLPPSFNVTLRSGLRIFKTQCGRTRTSADKQCTYCGGSHATLWRGGDSVKKLRALWSRMPAIGIDCALTTDTLQSYCVNGEFGSFDKQLQKISSIPKLVKHTVLQSSVV